MLPELPFLSTLLETFLIDLSATLQNEWSDPMFFKVSTELLAEYQDLSDEAMWRVLYKWKMAAFC